MHHGGPFSIPAINNSVPSALKPWIMIFFVVIFQFSGGVYLAAAADMAGSTGLMHEDILMAGYASLAGMGLTFTIMLRLKMRFTSRFSLLICSVALIISNLVCVTSGNVAVLVTSCFFAGIFRMWATFECNSSIQLWLTPHRDLSVFFCYVHLVVQSCMLLSGITNLWLAFFINWHYMHWIIIGMLLIVVLLVLCLFNNNRPQRPFPLFGIDWLGALLWGLILLIVNFICIYGDHYDWWNSTEIPTAFLFFIVLLALNLWRASFIRHPFIAIQTFRYKAVYLSLLLYVIIDILLSPAHLAEEIFFGEVLNYDALHLISLNWIGLTGSVAGAAFSYYYFAIRKNSYKSAFMAGFLSLVSYLALMYFLTDYTSTRQLIAIPLFLRNFGYIIIAVVLITNLIKVPFPHFFQSVSVQGFVSASVGPLAGTAFFRHFLNIAAAANFQFISAAQDGMNYNQAPAGQMSLSSLIEKQVLLVAFKELYGYLLIAGISCTILFIWYKYPYVPVKVLYPRMRNIRKMLRKEFGGPAN